jgi:hypothetical protein
MEEKKNLYLISKMKDNKKGLGKGKKGKKEDSCSSNQGKDLSHIKCFKCHRFGHYASHFHEKKGKGKQQFFFVANEEASTRVDEISSKLKAHFSMVSCLSSNIMFGVGS